MNIIGLIPARYASSRFPGKPLVELAGKSMIRWVYEAARKSKYLSEVVVATDHPEILEHVQTFGQAVLTSPHHPSGTDRCFEALQNLNTQYDYVINIQGDEPLVDPALVEVFVGSMLPLGPFFFHKRVSAKEAEWERGVMAGQPATERA